MLPLKDSEARVLAARIVLAITLVMVGCCSNVIFMELIVKYLVMKKRVNRTAKYSCYRKDSSAGNLITFAQFFVIALEGLFMNLEGKKLKKREIPFRWYLYNVAIYWLSSVIVNKAFAFQIAMPLHVVFRSGSLIAVLLLSMLVLNKRYSRTEVAAVAMVTAGIVSATLGSRKITSESAKPGSGDMMWWSVGVGMLAVASFLSAGLGILQESMFAQFGKHVSESMFYNHLLSLPCFGFFYADLLHHAHIFTQSAPLTIPLLGVAFPSLWLWLLGNVLTQYMCSKGVYILMSATSAVTVNIVVTCRKFISLLISVFCFGNPFTTAHWAGTILVFGGTYLYTMESLSKKDKTKGKTKV